MFFNVFQDLEIAADFNIVATAKDLLALLEQTDHVRVSKTVDI